MMMNFNQAYNAMAGEAARGDWADADVKFAQSYETDKLAERLNNILSALGSLRTTAGKLADRIFGPEPCGTNGGKAEASNGGSLHRLNTACEDIEVALSLLSGELTRLDRL